MAIVRLLALIGLGTTAIGVILELALPASAPMIDVGAIMFAAATWIVPPLMLAGGNGKSRSSLAKVGFVIGVVTAALSLSTVGLLLALMTLAFAKDTEWAWLALLIISAFWVAGSLWLHFGTHRARSGKEGGQ